MSKTLYRPADEPNSQVDGLPVEFAVFEDDAIDDALKNGWSTFRDLIGAEDRPKKKAAK